MRWHHLFPDITVTPTPYDTGIDFRVPHKGLYLCTIFVSYNGDPDTEDIDEDKVFCRIVYENRESRPFPRALPTTLNKLGTELFLLYEGHTKIDDVDTK